MARTNQLRFGVFSITAGIGFGLGLAAIAASNFGAVEDSLLSQSLSRALKDARANDAWMSSAIHQVSSQGEAEAKPLPAVVRPMAIGDQLKLGTHGGTARPFRVTEIRELDGGAAKIDAKSHGARLLLVTCLPVDGGNETPVRLVIEEPAATTASLPQSL